MATQVLDTTQTTSDVWTGIGGDTSVIIGAHAGGNWMVQVKAPDDTWIAVDPSGDPINSAGMWWYKSVSSYQYRLTGGTAGAKAWVAASNGSSPQIVS